MTNNIFTSIKLAAFLVLLGGLGHVQETISNSKSGKHSKGGRSNSKSKNKSKKSTGGGGGGSDTEQGKENEKENFKDGEGGGAVLNPENEKDADSKSGDKAGDKDDKKSPITPIKPFIPIKPGETTPAPAPAVLDGKLNTSQKMDQICKDNKWPVVNQFNEKAENNKSFVTYLESVKENKDDPKDVKTKKSDDRKNIASVLEFVKKNPSRVQQLIQMMDVINTMSDPSIGYSTLFAYCRFDGLDLFNFFSDIAENSEWFKFMINSYHGFKTRKIFGLDDRADSKNDIKHRFKAIKDLKNSGFNQLNALSDWISKSSDVFNDKKGVFQPELLNHFLNHLGTLIKDNPGKDVWGKISTLPAGKDQKTVTDKMTSGWLVVKNAQETILKALGLASPKK